ncbi:MAG TPA: ribosome biogenesis GTPase Der [Dehalococcoidia bacterium]|nr:ribosome biogenesis GTPase Der [Dehalococcoidia bacterium]
MSATSGVKRRRSSAGKAAKAIDLSLPVVAIVGRPNVGKSALFNRIAGGRIALVEDIPGTTRDRVYAQTEWRGRAFRLVDTGGLEAEGRFSDLVRRQVEAAIAEASVILFVVDAKEGLTAADLEVAELLRRTDRPVLLLANKVENVEREQSAVQFYELGLGEPIPVSAHHGRGVADVLDIVVSILPPPAGERPSEATEALRIAIVGRPNVGKSMLVNAILGEERVIVSEIPGTTRDAVDTPLLFEGKPVILIDTAGLRRPGKQGKGIERHAALRSRRAIERADVAFVVFDLTEGITAQDAHIVGYVLEAAKGLVLVGNKWDLVRGVEGFTRERIAEAVRSRLRFVPWASLAIVSALERTGVHELLTEAWRIREERRRRVDTGPLNQAIRRAIAERPPPSVRGKRAKVLYVTQPDVDPPTFVFFVNDPAAIHFSYRRFLEHTIRRAFGFDGTAIRLVFRGREESSRAKES